jgi:hypothetical protein
MNSTLERSSSQVVENIPEAILTNSEASLFWCESLSSSSSIGVFASQCDGGCDCNSNCFFEVRVPGETIIPSSN